MLRALPGGRAGNPNPSCRPSPPKRRGVDKLACLTALESKVLWLSTWMIHNANHLRPSRDGLKVGGHQASSASVATLMTALYLDVLRPQDRVAVKPHAAPVFHALQYLLGHQSRDKLERFRALRRRAVLPVAHQGRRHRRFLDRLGRARGRRSRCSPRWCRIICGCKRLVPTDDAAGPDDRARRRRRARRGQHLRGAARRLEARCPQSLVDHRLQPPEPRRGRLRPAVRPHRRAVRDVRLARRHAEIRPPAARPPSPGPTASSCANGSTPARTRSIRRWSTRAARAGASICSATSTAIPASARSSTSTTTTALQRLMTNLAGHDMELGARRLPRRHRRPADLLHRLHDQGLRPALRRPQGQPCRADEPGADGARSSSSMGGAGGRGMGAVRRARPAGRASWPRFSTACRSPRRRRAGIAPPPIAVPAESAGAARRAAVDPGGLRPDPRRRWRRATSELAARIVTTSPDVTVSTNLGAWVNRRGIFDRAERADTFREEKVVSAQRWAMSPQGQHIELGIAENNLFLLLAALGLAGPLFGARLLPIGTLYDPFIKRGLDALNYALLPGCRGSSWWRRRRGITLAPEGGAHQSVIEPLIGLGAARPRSASSRPLPTSWPCCCAGRSRKSSARTAIRSISGSRPGRSSSPSARLDAGARRGDRRRRLLAARAGARRGARDRLLRRRRARGARGARGDRAKTCRAPGCSRSPRPDRLHRDWRAALRTAESRRSPSGCWRGCGRAPRSSPSRDGHPATLSWLGARRAARGSCRSASTGSASRATSPTSTATTGSTRTRSSTPRRAPVCGPTERFECCNRPSRPDRPASLYCGPARIEAGCPGNLSFCPVSVSLSPSTFRIETSWSMKLPI